MDTFIELSIVLALAVAVSSLMRLLRQPLVVGYIVTGMLAGPFVLEFVHGDDYISLFSKIGIAVLLFIVGLSLNPVAVREVGAVSVFAGVGQVALTSAVGYALVRLLGYGNVPALYAAIALTFSSTIIVLKILSDKGDLGKLYGRVSIGLLLVQDLIATMILLVVSATAASEGGVTAATFASLVIKGAILTAALFAASRYVLPRLTPFFATSQELLFLFSIAWGLGLAAVFHAIGFSIEIGALIAGVTLSVSPFAYEIGSRMRPLRDFFVVLFFIALGSELALGELAAAAIPALGLSFFVLIGKPIIVFVLLNLLGFKRRTAFMTGLTVAQVSEFSLILMALAVSVGQISSEVSSLITLAGIATIAGSTYLMMYADAIFDRIEPLLKVLELRRGKARDRGSRGKSADIIIFGYDRVGADFVQAAEKLGGSFIAVDFNPMSIERLKEKGIPHKYGDAEDVEFLHELGLGSAKLVVSTIPDFRTNMLLVRRFRAENEDGVIMALSHDIEQTNELYEAGASYVVMPHYLGAQYAASMISRHGFDAGEFERERKLHQTRLGKRDSR